MSDYDQDFQGSIYDRYPHYSPKEPTPAEVIARLDRIEQLLRKLVERDDRGGVDVT